MALTPKNPTPQDKRAQAAAAEQDALLREVDDAVRQDSVATVAKRYGVPIGIGLVVLLAAFGGVLWYQHEQNAAREVESERLTQALDQLEANNSGAARTALESLEDESGPGVAAAAAMARAGVALERGDGAQAAQLFQDIADNGDAPQAMRDVAVVRAVAAQFDELPPAQVIERLQPYARPGNPFFGSAGEMTAIAHLKAGREDLAGPLLAQLAQDDSLPESLRSRTRQLAGLLGVDAITDVETLLEEQAAPAAAGQ